MKMSLALLLSLSLLPAAVRAADLSSHPGYVDFDGLPLFQGAEPNVEVTLNGTVLQLLYQLSAEAAAVDTSGLSGGLENIVIRVYEDVPELADEVLDFMNEHSATLLGRGWQRIVRVREDDEYVDIHLRLSEDGQSIYGIAIAALENGRRGSEAQFINIAGDYTMRDIASVSRQLGIGRLEGLDLP